MHVNLDREQLRSEEGQCTIGRMNFSYKGNSSMQKDLSPSGCAIILEVRIVCEGLLHTSGNLRTEEKLRKEIGGLEGRGEGL